MKRPRIRKGTAPQRNTPGRDRPAFDKTKPSASGYQPSQDEIDAEEKRKREEKTAKVWTGIERRRKQAEDEANARALRQAQAAARKARREARKEDK